MLKVNAYIYLASVQQENLVIWILQALNWEMFLSQRAREVHCSKYCNNQDMAIILKRRPYKFSFQKFTQEIISRFLNPLAPKPAP